MCVDYKAARSELQAQSKSREISGTLFQRIKSQIGLQPYHGYTNLKQGGKSLKKNKYVSSLTFIMPV
jgi:hypothetical protein